MNDQKSVRKVRLVVVLLMLAGCASAAPKPTAPPATEISPAGVEPSAGEASSAVATPAQRTLEPQPVKFMSLDGTPLAGLYWPPVKPGSPGVVLMHMMGGSKTDWLQFGALLQGNGGTQDGSRPEATTAFAVLAVDFRGHGDSGGSRDDRTGMIGDARAALNLMRSLPDVNPGRIIMIGASIGGDAAVDACTDGCIGTISLSPGGFLGVPYNEALRALGDKPALCVASVGDRLSADTCNHGETLGLNDFQVNIYQGAQHGTNMFAIQDQKPFLTDLLFAWLQAHAS